MTAYGEAVTLEPQTPRIRPLHLLLGWAVSAATVVIAAWLLPGVELLEFGSGFLVALAVAAFNAILPRCFGAAAPFVVALGFLLALFATRCCLCWPPGRCPTIDVSGFGDALLAALVMAAVSLTLEVILGTDDDDEYGLRVVRRVARRQGKPERTECRILFLEIDGLALPMLRDAMRDGSAPEMASWLAKDGYHLSEWETDLSSQTGASQAGILLGSNKDIPAFRWVEKETRRVISCSSPPDCAEIDAPAPPATGCWSRAAPAAATCLGRGARDDPHRQPDRGPAARDPATALFANGFNVTRSFVLFIFEIGLEVTSSLRAARRDIRPRGHRGGSYPLLRGVMCVIIRDLSTTAC